MQHTSSREDVRSGSGWEALTRWAELHPRAAVAWTCAILAVLAWFNRFAQDDAFIQFQYAAHLVQGRGLVWLTGERVEGYTSFLWTLFMCVPIGLHLDPVPFSYAAGLALFCGTLLATYSLALTLLGSRSTALLTLWLLGANYTFLA